MTSDSVGITSNDMRSNKSDTHACRTVRLSRRLALQLGVAATGVLSGVAAGFEDSGLTGARRLIEATVRIETAGERSSGVFVSNEGHILTVAHGLSTSDRRIQITAGKEILTARIVYRDDAEDVAVLKTNEASRSGIRVLSFVSPKSLNSLPLNTELIACGLPARDESSSLPVVRRGLVGSRTPRWIRTSCRLTTGDSGGPVATQDGFLVGINARIGAGRDANLHIPIARIRRSSADSNLAQLFESQVDCEFAPERSCPEAVVTNLETLSCQVLDATRTGIANGCRLNSELIVAKLSLVDKDVSFVRIGDRILDAKLIVSEREADLAIVRTRPLDGMRSLELPAIRQTSLSPGESTFSGNQREGMLGRWAHNEPGTRPALGCTLLMDRDQQILVESISPGTAASQAGLQQNDQLLRVGTVECRTLDDVGIAIERFLPGDHIDFEFLRDNRRMIRSGQLTHHPNHLLDRNENLDGLAGRLSQRRTGFPGIFQHDPDVLPSEMGGPVLDSAGTLVGINIAVRARESVLAIPIRRVLDLVERTGKRLK